MRVDIKFCGLTRAQDAALGVALGARYLGVVFAPSPRRVSAAQALAVFSDVAAAGAGGPQRVGVFAAEAAAVIARQAREARLDVVQLHGDPTAEDVLALRGEFAGEVWAARRIADDGPGDLSDLVGIADRILIDSRNGTALGGTGTTFGWERAAAELARVREKTPIVVAGGLTPDNVQRAIALLRPSVVDVSSGVERSPGIKDETLMRAFARAAGAWNT